jgi:hypothetical protein
LLKILIFERFQTTPEVLMKSIKQLGFLFVFSFALAFSANAQDEIDQLVSGSVGDAEKLVGAYIDPLMNSASSGLNQGWYNTAKTHKTAGVDLTFSFNAMLIPSDKLFYNVADLNLEKIDMHPSSPGYKSPTEKIAPTIFGSDKAPVFYTKPLVSNTFNGPAGLDMKGKIGLSAMPMPTATLGFGLPKGFDIKVRFIPQTNLGNNTQVNLWGIGVMHDVKQWIPGIKSLPFDLSGFVGYTTMKMTSKFNSSNTQDARGVFTMNGLTLQGIISKKISVLTVYGAVGYNMAKSNLSLLGKYDINDDGDYTDAREVNPMKLDYSASGPRVTAGFRLKLAVFTIHSDYTLQKYSCFAFGLGISVR